MNDKRRCLYVCGFMAVVTDQKMKRAAWNFGMKFWMFVGYDVLNKNIIKTGVTKLRSVLQRRTLSVTLMQLFLKKF